MRAVLATVGVAGARVELRPVGAKQHPAARWNASVLAFPRFDAGNREDEVLVGRGLARTVDHAGTGNEVARVDGVDRVVGPVAAGDPVDRGVEMRSGMLAAAEIVPIPLA